MKRTPIIILLAVLAAVAITAVILYSRVGSTKKALRASEKELSDLNAKVIQLTQENSSLQDQIRKDAEGLKDLAVAKELISRLENEVSLKEAKLSEIQEMASELGQALEAEQKKNALVQALQQELEARKSQHSRLEGELAESKDQVNLLQTKVLDLEKQKEMADAELETTAALKDQALQQFQEGLLKMESEFKKEIESRDTTTHELEGVVQKWESNAHRLEAELAESKNELNLLGTKMVDLREQKEVADAELSALKSRYEGLLAAQMEEQKACKAQIDALENTITLKDQAFQQVQEGLLKMESEFKKEIESRDTTTHELEEEVQRWESNAHRLEGELTESQDELNLIGTKVADLQKQKEVADVELSALKSRYEGLVAQLEDQKAWKERIDALEHSITLKDRSLQQIQEELLKIESEAKEKIGGRDVRIHELEKEVERWVSNALHLEKELAESLRELSLLEEKVADLQKQKEVADVELSALKSRYEGLVAQLKYQDICRQEMDRIRAEFDQAKKDEASLRNELTTSSAQLIRLGEDFVLCESRLQILEDDLAERRSQIRLLKGQLADLSGQRTLIESRIAQLKATYNALISDLKKQIENDQVTIKEFEEKISVSFVDSILFEFGKATITDEGMKVLDKIGNTLRNVQARQIRVVGHTDNVSIMPQYQYKFPSNWELSAARAAAVVRYLQEQIGIDPKTLEVVGHSFYHPVADNETPAGRARNRRVTIVIAPRI